MGNLVSPASHERLEEESQPNQLDRVQLPSRKAVPLKKALMPQVDTKVDEKRHKIIEFDFQKGVTAKLELQISKGIHHEKLSFFCRAHELQFESKFRPGQDTPNDNLDDDDESSDDFAKAMLDNEKLVSRSKVLDRNSQKYRKFIGLAAYMLMRLGCTPVVANWKRFLSKFDPHFSPSSPGHKLAVSMFQGGGSVYDLGSTYFFSGFKTKLIEDSDERKSVMVDCGGGVSFHQTFEEDEESGAGPISFSEATLKFKKDTLYVKHRSTLMKEDGPQGGWVKFNDKMIYEGSQLKNVLTEDEKIAFINFSKSLLKKIDEPSFPEVFVLLVQRMVGKNFCFFELDNMFP